MLYFSLAFHIILLYNLTLNFTCNKTFAETFWFLLLGFLLSSSITIKVLSLFQIFVSQNQLEHQKVEIFSSEMGSNPFIVNGKLYGQDYDKIKVATNNFLSVLLNFSRLLAWNPGPFSRMNTSPPQTIHFFTKDIALIFPGWGLGIFVIIHNFL